MGSLLAPVDPAGAWALICQALGPDAAVETAIGLNVTAHLDLDRGMDWSPPIPLPAAFADQLTADRVARAAIAGRSGDGGRSALPDLPDWGTPGAPARDQVLLVAVAATQPERALAVAGEMLGRHAPRKLGDALRLAAVLLTRAGLGDRVASVARQDSYVASRSGWVVRALPGRRVVRSALGSA
ncbi:MAG TPA: hypothetical protein VE196_10060 [Pseudonocardiaceae bacterium]|nr:hypothetical protein [Pseudonocardiaceae bacterium]